MSAVPIDPEQDRSFGGVVPCGVLHSCRHLARVERVHAIVVLTDGAKSDADVLIASIRARSGPLLTPKTLEFRDHLPLTNLGKVDKKALKSTLQA